MRYLTVQDMLWISLQVVGRPQKFQYAKLEEATFTQYIYGESQAPIEHAIRFFDRLASAQTVRGSKRANRPGCLSGVLENERAAVREHKSDNLVCDLRRESRSVSKPVGRKF